MNCWNSEPSLIDTLSDPIVQAIMTADGFDPHRLKASLREAALKVAQPCT